MAWPINVGDVLEVRLIGSLHSQVVMNVFHYELDDAAADGAAAVAALLSSFETSVWTPLRTGLSNELNSVYFEGQVIHPFRYRKVTHVPANRAGTSGDNSLPSGVSIVARRQGDPAKRWSQGRIYIPGLPQTQELDSKILNAWMILHAPNIQVALQALLTPGGAGPQGSPIIFNLASPMRKTPVRYCLVDNVIRYQRRREIGVGI